MAEFPPQPVEDGRRDPFSLWGLRDTMLQPLADAAPGDNEEKRALREQVAALQQQVADLQARAFAAVGRRGPAAAGGREVADARGSAGMCVCAVQYT